MSAVYKDDQEDWMTVCLKYLLFVFNFLFWMGGAAVLGVGVWTLVEKSDYLSLLASSTFAVSAYILILAGGLVVVTGFLGCCAVIREQRSCLSMAALGGVHSQPQPGGAGSGSTEPLGRDGRTGSGCGQTLTRLVWFLLRPGSTPLVPGQTRPVNVPLQNTPPRRNMVTYCSAQTPIRQTRVQQIPTQDGSDLQ